MSATLPPSQTGTKVRLLRSSDLPRVMEIEQTSFTTPWSEKTFEGLLRRTDTDLLGAVRDDRLIGYAVAWTVAGQSELGNVAVAPEARGLGIGRLLVSAVVQRLRFRHVSDVFLEVRESNEVARTLYDTAGFTIVGRRRAYYSQPTEDALVMRLTLGED